MFLNDQDLFRLTGYRQKAKQIAHLKASKIPFHVDRYGRPRVACSVVEGRGKAAKPADTWSPSWAGVPQST